MTRENLVTDGSEFITPDGAVYSGPYHVHHSMGAMVGATHSDTAHEILLPLNEGAEDKLDIILRSLKQEMKQIDDHRSVLKRNFSTPFPRQGSSPTSPVPPVTRQSGQMQTPPPRRSTGTGSYSGY